jgi:hypothetical protein
MKKLFILLAFLVCGIVQAQNPKHVKWIPEYKDGTITIKAEIEKNWHTYSQKPSEGPVPTAFKFTPSADYELVGNTEESESHEEFDKTFDAKVYLFNDKAEFRQKIKIKKKSVIEITIDYMVCNDAMCIMEGPLKITVNVQ